MTNKKKLAEIKKAIQEVIDYPTKEQGRRTEDGYPTEFAYDEFAYKRIVDSYRRALKNILDKFG